VANEAAQFYEITDCVGIIATIHAAIVLKNKVYIHPKQEKFEPYIEYTVPIKDYVLDPKIKAYMIRYEYENFWALKRPIHRGLIKRVTNKFIYGTSSNQTEYGDIIPNDVITEIIKEGICYTDSSISRRWKNTWNYFNWVMNR
jgi:hypothetical protein